MAQFLLPPRPTPSSNTPMRPLLRLAPPLLLAVLCVATAVVWARSYWRVDKAWLQILPKYSADLQLTPGRLTVGGAPSAVRLPVGEGDWFTWSVDSYYAEYIPPPTNTFRGEFEVYNGRVTVPFWFVMLGAMALSFTAIAPAILRHFAAARSTRPRIFPASLEPGFPAGTLLRRDDPLVAVMLHDLSPEDMPPADVYPSDAYADDHQPSIATPAFEAAVDFEATIPMSAAPLNPVAPQTAALVQAVS
jgi:hypothetical protein